QVVNLTLNDPLLRDLARQFGQIREDYRDERDEQSYPLLLAENVEGARDFLMEQQRDTYQQPSEIAAALGSGSQREAKRVETQGNLIICGTGLAALVISLILVSTLTRLIATPLQNLAGVADRIGVGDLDVEVKDL